jgi:hypothetical protein
MAANRVANDLAQRLHSVCFREDHGAQRPGDVAALGRLLDREDDLPHRRAPRLSPGRQVPGRVSRPRRWAIPGAAVKPEQRGRAGPVGVTPESGLAF